MSTKCNLAETRSLVAAHCAELRQTLSEDELSQLKAIPAEKLLLQTHFGLAQYIRNRWLHGEPSPLNEAFESGYPFAHSDDISALLVDVLWRDLHSEDLTDTAFRDLLHKHSLFP